MIKNKCFKSSIAALSIISLSVMSTFVGVTRKISHNFKKKWTFVYQFKRLIVSFWQDCVGLKPIINQGIQILFEDRQQIHVI